MCHQYSILLFLNLSHFKMGGLQLMHAGQGILGAGIHIQYLKVAQVEKH